MVLLIIWGIGVFVTFVFCALQGFLNESLLEVVFTTVVSLLWPIYWSFVVFLILMCLFYDRNRFG